MKDTNKKILQFPTPPDETMGTTAFFQVGSTRFAIHWSIQHLPAAKPMLPLVPRAKDTTGPIRSIKSAPEAPEGLKPPRTRTRKSGRFINASAG